MKKIAITLTGIILCGCSHHMEKSPEVSPKVTERAPSTQDQPLSINRMLDEQIPLTLKQAWPLLYKESHQGRYLQKIKSSVQDQEFTITVHLSITPNKIEFIALHDIYGRVYELVWTPDSITWKGSEHLPKTVRPENILTDFLLVHLSSEALRECCGSLMLSEEGSPQNFKRILKTGSTVLREIHQQDPLGLFWKSATLHNPEYKYTLDIQTVQLP